MQRKLTLAVVICLLILSFSARSQYYYYNNNYYDKDVIWEVGASVGAMNSITDVGTKKGSMLFPISQVNFKSTELNASFYISAMYQSVVGLRLEATWGKISGADSNGAVKERNLSFRTPINEIAGIVEFHPFNLKYHDEPSMVSPYIAGGIGYFSFNPQAKLNGSWVDLQPLRTEGQGFPELKQLRGDDMEPYKRHGINIITGLGISFEPTPFITCRGEFLLRTTFTDYLDDVSKVYIDPAWFDNNLSTSQAVLAKQLFDRSQEKQGGVINAYGDQRGNWKINDSYLTFNFKVGINLGRQRIN